MDKHIEEVMKANPRWFFLNCGRVNGLKPVVRLGSGIRVMNWASASGIIRFEDGSWMPSASMEGRSTPLVSRTIMTRDSHPRDALSLAIPEHVSITMTYLDEQVMRALAHIEFVAIEEDIAVVIAPWGVLQTLGEMGWRPVRLAALDRPKRSSDPTAHFVHEAGSTFKLPVSCVRAGRSLNSYSF